MPTNGGLSFSSTFSGALAVRDVPVVVELAQPAISSALIRYKVAIFICLAIVVGAHKKSSKKERWRGCLSEISNQIERS